jgi:hypothetical protein
MIRYNSTLNVFEGYKSGAWSEIGGGSSDTWTTNNFTGNGSTAAYTLTQAPSSEDNVIAFIEGVFQNPADFVVSGTTITFDDNIPSGQKVVVHTVKATVAGNNLNQDAFTGDNSTTAFTLSIAPINENNTMVYIDGVYQNKSTYSVANQVLTFSTAPATSAAVEVLTFTQTTINAPTTNSVSTTSLIDDSVTSPKLGHALTLQGNTVFNGSIQSENISIPDNYALRVGSSQDLQIFHNGSHSHIRNTTGNLYLQDDGYVEIGSASGEVYIGAIKDGAVNLRYDNATKLATTSTGIAANGTVTATTFTGTTFNGDLNGTVNAATTATTQANSVANTTVATTAFVSNKITELIGGAPSTLNDLNELAAAINDDANYNSTLTTALATKLPLAGGTLTGHLNGTSFGSGISATVGISGSVADLNSADLGPGYLTLARDDTADAAQLRFAKNGSVHSYLETRALGLGFVTSVGGFIFEGGNVGIGNTNPADKLVVQKDSGNIEPILVIKNDNTTDDNGTSIDFSGKDTGGNNVIYGRIAAMYSNHATEKSHMIFSHRNDSGNFTQWMRVSHDGHVGIGTHSPSAPLHIQTNDGTTNSAVNSLMITNLSTGTTTTGFGGEIRFQAERNSGVNQNTGGIRSVAEVNLNTNISSGMAFDTSAAGVNSEKLRITFDGDIGIGTDAPSFHSFAGDTNTRGIQISNPNNDSSAQLKLTGRNNTGTPGQATHFEIGHRGDSLRTTMRHGGNDTIDINSSGHIHLNPYNSSSTQLYIGGQGGYFGGNSSHNMRAAGAQFMFNAGGSSGSYIFEANGQARLTIDNLGVSQIRTNKTGDNYDLYVKSQNSSDPGLAIFRDGQVGFGISVRNASENYTDFLLSSGGSPDFFPDSTGGSGTVGPMRLYYGGSVSMPYTAAWSSGIGHVFTNSGAHYQIVTSTSTGNEKAIISNSVGAGGAVGILQYRNGGAVRGDYLVADHNNGIYFNSTSDYRFKENVTDIPDGCLDKLTSLRPITYTHSAAKDDDTTTVHSGFIAHEVDAVFPEFVIGDKDAVYTQEDLDAKGDQDTVTKVLVTLFIKQLLTVRKNGMFI